MINYQALKDDHVPRALTIAGSDSGAGAGIQADLKTFAALGTYGLSVITAVTAQNTLTVVRAQDIATDIIVAQIDAVMADIGADVAKTGMLASPEIIEVVSERARYWGLRLVVDPVMVAKGGAVLLRPEAVSQLRTQLLPLAEVVTPNLPEAEVLVGHELQTTAQLRDAAHAIYDMGPRYVVIKGGHRIGAPIDILYDGHDIIELEAERIETAHTHGTGCTFSAAITAFMARKLPVTLAIPYAKRYITGAILHAPGIGHGHGPTDHFWLWSRDNLDPVAAILQAENEREE